MPVELYKYGSASRTLMLRSRLVRLSQAGSFNDPFELRPFFPSPREDEAMLRQLHEMMVESGAIDMPYDDYVDAVRAGRIPVAQEVFHKAPAAAAVAAEHFAEWANREVGVLCLAEGPLDPVMWAHYGDDHRGVVIGFSTGDPFFSPRSGYEGLQPVTYAVDRPDSTIEDATNEELFYTKAECWQFEREWRMLLPHERGQETGDSAFHTG